MDVILAQILICNIGVRRELARLKSEKVMTPNIKGLGTALAKMKHSLEAEVAPLMASIEAVGPEAITAIQEAKKHVADVKAMVQDVKDFSASLKGDNGGPTLDDSSESSVTSEAEARHDGEPGKSWANGQT